MYRVMKDYKIVGVVEEWSATDRKFHPDLRIEQDTEHQVSDFVMCGEEYLLREDPRAIESEKARVRSIRDGYLVQFVDPIISNQIRFSEMPESDKEKILNYRRYLLDYTNDTNWWESTPKTLDEWSE